MCRPSGRRSKAVLGEGQVRHWVEAYHHGHVTVSGDPGVVKLLGNVIQRQQARARS
jgi:hypothetical protein